MELNHRNIGNEQQGHSIELCVSAHVTLRMMLSILSAIQLHFLANKNAELASRSQ